MKNLLKIITFFLLLTTQVFSQWTLQLSSNVELRTWKLTTKADKEEKGLGGASIVLTQGSTVISKSSSESNGDFTVFVPANGDFVLTVSFAGCNSKKFLINTQNVPDEIAKDNFKPTFAIGGFIMAKPFPGIDYSGLQQTLVTVEYKPKGKKFDHNDDATDKGLSIVQKIAEAENSLIEKFCSTNKAGDVALAKPDCPLAKSLYEKAIALIPGEQYPVTQLEKVGLCLKDKELAAKKAAEEAAAKSAANTSSKEASDKKAIADALAKVAADKAAAIKEEEAKLAKATNAKAAKEQASNNKAPKQKAPVEKVNTVQSSNTTNDKTSTKKKDAIKIKQKSPQELEKEAKLAKQHEGMAKSKAEDEEAIKADAEKAKARREEKQKAAREKEEKQKEGLAKSKAEDEAAMKADEEKKEKAAAERKAKEDEKKKLAYETKTKDSEGEMDKGNSDHSIPQVLGGAEKYKEKIKAADELFKRKRYDEAKKLYEEALSFKQKDVYATSKLTEIEKIKVAK